MNHFQDNYDLVKANIISGRKLSFNKRAYFFSRSGNNSNRGYSRISRNQANPQKKKVMEKAFSVRRPSSGVCLNGSPSVSPFRFSLPFSSLVVSAR